MKPHKVCKLKDTAKECLSIDQLCNNENLLSMSRIEDLIFKVKLSVAEIFKCDVIGFLKYDFHGTSNRAVVNIQYHFSIKGRTKQMNVISISSCKKIKGV